jgi:DNA-binding CsgD family transcriptional regulator/PAS domain-containing protein
MNANAQLLSVVGDIYDTTFDQTRWNSTLERIVEHVGAEHGVQSCALLSMGAAGEIRLGYKVGITPHFAQTYVDHYRQFDPAHAIRLSEIGRIHSVEDWVPLDDYRKGHYYREWVRPQRFEDAAGVLLDKSADGFSYLGLIKSGGPVDDGLRRALASIVPHLRRATLIGQVLNRRTEIAAPIEQALDALKAAIFLLDSSGNITHVNEGGRDILERRDFLRTERGRLIAADPQLNRILREAMAASVLGDGATRSESIALPFTAQDGERFVGHVLPLTAGQRRRTGAMFDASAILFVRKTSLDVLQAADIIKGVFKLTPAEARVLLTIVDAGGVAESAKNLDVAESTVKTHLGRIFTKTDTKRQADLVKLVAAFSSPVRR